MVPLSLLLLPGALPASLRLGVDGAARRSTASLAPPRRPRIGREVALRLPTSVSAVASEEARAPAGERFDWLDQWYPVAPVCDLDPRKPHGKTVLGLSIVAWFDGGEWRVVDDACPHRLAPLSEGRVDDKGRLECAYHGWCFDGCGSCQFIPQAPALAPLCTRTARRAWRRTRAWCRTTSCGSTRGRSRSTATCCRESGRHIFQTSMTRPSTPSSASGTSSTGTTCWWRTSWTLLMSPTHTRGSSLSSKTRKIQAELSLTRNAVARSR